MSRVPDARQAIDEFSAFVSGQTGQPAGAGASQAGPSQVPFAGQLRAPEPRVIERPVYGYDEDDNTLSSDVYEYLDNPELAYLPSSEDIVAEGIRHFMEHDPEIPVDSSDSDEEPIDDIEDDSEDDTSDESETGE